jgi:hypothetical protein
MDSRKRQIVQALKIVAIGLENHEAQLGNDGLAVDFEGERYLILHASLAAELIYVMRKAAAWMEMEEGENGEEAETKAAS